MENKKFTIETLGIDYHFNQTENGNQIILSEKDFEKIFSHLNQLEQQVEDLQNELIESLKKQALIRNIING
ncbi:MAG: hypothetical protein EAZ20_01400 [Bacteroidetes bacterium]|nr:MAG: hypothetical protein EAZ20_01400 [Bacteroidota bacterium]